jgi:integrase/recombinase XerD
MEIDINLKNSFEKWLKTLGYAESTVYASGNYVRDFFIWLLKQEIRETGQITKQVTSDYYNYLQTRQNKLYGGGLSGNYIVNNINALKRFSRYLQATGKANIVIKLKMGQSQAIGRQILSKAEVQALYRACTGSRFGIRDRAMLGIFYGCGLRRSEGLSLDVKDILLKEKMIFVRKGKNHKERYVPMTEVVKGDLENYICVAREKLLNQKNGRPEALFLNSGSKRLRNGGLYERMKRLTAKSGIQKSPGIHTLRHSIATHLLQAGLSLEEVKQFLGHASLETTQIYTHIVNDQQINGEQEEIPV